MSAEHRAHGAEDLCAPGVLLYERAVRDGRVPVADAAPTPCLVEFGLLHPVVEDLDWLEPVSPAIALHRLLRVSEERVVAERRRGELLAETFEPLLRLGEHRAGVTDTPALRVLSGVERINAVISQTLAEASGELLAVQPRSGTRIPAERLASALDRDRALLERGGRIRTLYQHTLRHSPAILARYEQLNGDVEARTLDEVTERLLIVDRAVAFVPANPENSDYSLALEIRHPALVSHFATTFDRLWRLALPMHPVAAHHPSQNGVTHRQHAIAALLIEGHTDAVIAERLGMNVRTVRVHIAKLAATLGSESRAQLGYLIGRSGILDQED
ncbi:LuxR C-terminal-related transcriptional regulator [Streptomyces sp. NPDC091279]|uniref:helix-turn-helix transcriptional regulator n=1 Tax=unclassified Streptomyces TaxID=2593676 RepID=UPI0038088C35